MTAGRRKMSRPGCRHGGRVHSRTTSWCADACGRENAFVSVDMVQKSQDSVVHPLYVCKYMFSIIARPRPSMHLAPRPVLPQWLALVVQSCQMHGWALDLLQAEMSRRLEHVEYASKSVLTMVSEGLRQDNVCTRPESLYVPSEFCCEKWEVAVTSACILPFHGFSAKEFGCPNTFTLTSCTCMLDTATPSRRYNGGSKCHPGSALQDPFRGGSHPATSTAGSLML